MCVCVCVCVCDKINVSLCLCKRSGLLRDGVPIKTLLFVITLMAADFSSTASLSNLPFTLCKRGQGTHFHMSGRHLDQQVSAEG